MSSTTVAPPAAVPTTTSAPTPAPSPDTSANLRPESSCTPSSSDPASSTDTSIPPSVVDQKASAASAATSSPTDPMSHHAAHVPSHPFYPSHHPLYQHHPNAHAAYQFQTPYAYTPPYFQPHPIYPMHPSTGAPAPPNWPPGVSHAPFTPAHHHSFYAWPPTPLPPPPPHHPSSPRIQHVSPHHHHQQQQTAHQSQQQQQQQQTQQQQQQQSLLHQSHEMVESSGPPRHRRRPSLSGSSPSPRHRHHQRPPQHPTTPDSFYTDHTSSHQYQSVMPLRRPSRRRGQGMEDGDDYNNANMRTGDRTRMLTKHGDGAVDGKNQYHSHHQHQIDPLVASSSNVSSSSSTSSGSASMMSPNGMNGTGGIHDRKTSNHGHHHMHHHHHSNANGSIKANGGRPPAAENGVNNASSGSNHNGGNNNSSSNNTNSNNNANNNNGPDRDLQLQMAELDENARKTVSGADDVTLALLLTSWANSLEEARHHTAAGQSASTTHFEAIFNGSHALDIVTNNVLVAHPSSDSPVRKALIALFGYVLYGDHRLHARLAELVVDLNANSNGSNFNVNEAAGSTAYIGPDSSVSVAVSRTLAFLKDVASNMRAYADVLPTAPDVRDKPIRGYSPDSHSPTLESAINSKSDSFEDSASKKDDHSMLPTSEASGPAGPDPIKAVERSMDTWRRAVARLQGEMALIVVLNKALGAADVELRFDPMNGSSNSSDAFVNGVNMNVNGAAGMAVSGTSGSSAIDAFYAGVRQAVRKHIEADLSARIDRLNAVYWADVAQGAEATVFGAARERARHWARQLDSGRREVESLLDEAGIGFGPSAAVVDPTRVEVLLGAAAATAAVVACHQRAFEWAKNTAHILAAMVMAMRCLEGVADGRLSPSSELRKKFFAGLNAAYAAVDGILDWSFATLHNKVLVSLDKSCGGTGDIKIAGALASTDHALGGSPGAATIGGNDEESRGMGRNGEGGMATNGSKTLRFQEPPKTPGDPTGENGSITGRPKVRHARMKSSPDALLHLNFPRFDGYSDDDYDDVDEKIDREISFHDDDDDDDNDGNNDRRGAGHDAANQGEAHGNGADNDGKSDSASKLTSSGDIGKDSFSTGDIRMVFVDRGGANGKDVSSVTVGETEDSATEGSDKPSLSDKVRFDEGALKRGLNGSGADSGGASTNGVAGCGNGKTNGVEHGGSTAGGNEDDDCDDETEDIDMIVHGDEEDEDETVEVDVDDQTKPKKMNHASHFRSVSVDGGIPF